MTFKQNYLHFFDGHDFITTDKTLINKKGDHALNTKLKHNNR